MNPPRGWQPAAMAVAMVLLAAAALKGAALAGGSGAHLGPWRLPPWPAAVAVGWEWALGVWLLTGWHPGASRLAGIATCAVLTALAAALVVAGIGDCGCFGRHQPPAGAILALDIAMLAALLGSRVRPEPAPTPLRIPLGLLAGTVAAVLALAGGRAPLPALAAAFPPDGGGGAGTAAAAVTAITGIDRGEWIVVFHSRLCPECRAALPEWIAAARRSLAARGGPAWAFACVDAGAGSMPPPGLPPGVVACGVPLDIVTPLGVRLRDGRVVVWGADPRRVLPAGREARAER